MLRRWAGYQLAIIVSSVLKRIAHPAWPLRCLGLPAYCRHAPCALTRVFALPRRDYARRQLARNQRPDYHRPRDQGAEPCVSAPLPAILSAPRCGVLGVGGTIATNCCVSPTCRWQSLTSRVPVSLPSTSSS